MMINENVINNGEIFVNHRMIPLKDVYEHSKIAYSIGYNNGLFAIVGFDKESEQKKPFNKIHFYYKVENDVLKAFALICIYILLSEKTRQRRYWNTVMIGTPFSFSARQIRSSLLIL